MVTFVKGVYSMVISSLEKIALKNEELHFTFLISNNNQ